MYISHNTNCSKAVKRFTQIYTAFLFFKLFCSLIQELLTGHISAGTLNYKDSFFLYFTIIHILFYYIMNGMNCVYFHTYNTRLYVKPPCKVSVGNGEFQP
jgi:hypothetical protein